MLSINYDIHIPTNRNSKNNQSGDGYSLLLGAIGSLAILAAQKPPCDLVTVLTGLSLGHCAQRPAAGRSHGFPDFNAATCYGVLALRSTPASIVAQLSKAMQEIARLSEVRQTLQRQGAQAFASSLKQTARIIEAELAKWGKVQKIAQVQ